MEISLVINFQFEDKQKQEALCDALLLYAKGNFQGFCDTIDQLLNINNALANYPVLSPDSGPESITRKTKAGNTIAYFLCGSSDAEELGQALRDLLIQLGVVQFKGYLESDFGEKQNLKKFPEARKKSSATNNQKFVDAYAKYVFDFIILEHFQPENLDKRQKDYQKLADDVARYHQRFIGKLSKKAQNIWRSAFLKEKKIDPCLEIMRTELAKIDDSKQALKFEAELKSIIASGLGIDRLNKGLIAILKDSLFD